MSQPLAEARMFTLWLALEQAEERMRERRWRAIEEASRALDWANRLPEGDWFQKRRAGEMVVEALGAAGE